MSITHPTTAQKLLFLLFVLLLALVFTEKAHAAAYMKLGDIKGDVSNPDHKNWINLESVAMPPRGGSTIMHTTATSRTASTATGAAGGSQATTAVTGNEGAANKSRRQYEPITFTKRIDKSSPMLQEAAAKGTVFATATLDATDPNDPAQPMRIELENVMITSYQTSGSTGSASVPMESFSLNYEEIKYTKLPKTKKAR
jgi:type VI protein secretion system component Hcp